MKIALYDNCFYGDLGCSKIYPPTKFQWDRLPSSQHKITVFTDYCLNQVDHPLHKNSKKIALLIEPYAINPYSYKWIKEKENYSKFDLVLTHHSSYLDLDMRFQFYPNGMCWVKMENFGKVEKTKNTSIIASSKNFAPGHQFRHQLIAMAKRNNLLDVYGYGYNKLDDKYDGLKDYRFSVAIENSKANHYFTEKLIDCFASYSIPVYWGCPEIGKFFNTDGIVVCNNVSDMLKQLYNIQKNGDEIYQSKLKAIEENCELSKKYVCAENWIYDNILTNPKFDFIGELNES